MTLNGVIKALILRYFTEFDSFGGRLVWLQLKIYV